MIKMKVVIIDNYDSFTYNLFQLTGTVTGVSPLVFSNDALSYGEFARLAPDAVIISPGPGNPLNRSDFGVCAEIIAKTRLPLLGVCLGHQGIAGSFGGTIVYAPEVMHGRTSAVFHNGDKLFSDIPQGFTAVRYHSLMVDKHSFPGELSITAWTDDGIVMGLRHRERPLWGVQFHPESIGTEHGETVLRNFLVMAKRHRYIDKSIKGKR